MGFIFTFSKLLGISEKTFINSMRSFKGLPHRFEIFLKKMVLHLLMTQKQLHLKPLNLHYLV